MLPFGFVCYWFSNKPSVSRILGPNSGVLPDRDRILCRIKMDPAENPLALQWQVDQLTALVSQLLEGRAAQSILPDSPP